MIRIRIDPEKREIEMTGHAGAGGPGFDQVCCAASAIIKAYLKRETKCAVQYLDLSRR